MDVIAIQRIEKSLDRFGERFLSRFFTEEEKRLALARTAPARTLAKRFAAKEACAKALGTGVGEGISWVEMKISLTLHGQPSLTLTGKAHDRLLNLTPPGFLPQIHVSLADDVINAYAFVVISADLMQGEF